MREAGHRIIWADDVIAWEVPGITVTLRWAFARSYRIGVTDAHMEPSGRRHRHRRATRMARGEVWRPRAAGAERPASEDASPLRGWDARGIGLVAGTVGVSYDEYRTIHGD